MMRTTLSAALRYLTVVPIAATLATALWLPTLVSAQSDPAAPAADVQDRKSVV